MDRGARLASLAALDPDLVPADAPDLLAGFRATTLAGFRFLAERADLLAFADFFADRAGFGAVTVLVFLVGWRRLVTRLLLALRLVWLGFGFASGLLAFRF